MCQKFSISVIAKSFTFWSMCGICILKMRDLKTEVGIIFCNLCNQINGKCVDMIVSAANFAMSNSNSKCPHKFLHMNLCYMQS